MRSRLIVTAAILGLIVLVGLLIQIQKRDQIKPAQDKHKEEKPEQAGELPPGQQTFYATYRITDPQKKLEALEKFVSDFPNSSQMGQARRQIFKATLKQWPNDKKKIMDAAARMIKPPDDPRAKIANIPEYQFIAKELLSAEVLLDEAESFALKSLEFSKDHFAGSLRDRYAEWKRPAPSQATIDREYLDERLEYSTTLGRIYLRRGKIPQGEQILRKAYTADPTISPAAFGLAELAEKKGDYETATDYLATATLSAGYVIADVRSRFENLYRKTHNGSNDGLEDLLDVRYRKLFPNPIKVEPYEPTASRTKRLVLAEAFTGAG